MICIKESHMSTCESHLNFLEDSTLRKSSTGLNSYKYLIIKKTGTIARVESLLRSIIFLWHLIPGISGRKLSSPGSHQAKKHLSYCTMLDI